MSSFVLPESPHWAVGFVWRKTLWMEDMTTTGFGTPSASRSGFGCFCSTPTHSVKAIQKPSANAFGCFRWDRRKYDEHMIRFTNHCNSNLILKPDPTKAGMWVGRGLGLKRWGLWFARKDLVGVSGFKTWHPAVYSTIRRAEGTQCISL